VTRATTPAIAALLAGAAGPGGVAPERVFKTLVVSLPRGLAVAVLTVPRTRSVFLGSEAAPTVFTSFDNAVTKSQMTSWQAV
jgi:hypothetical protein